MGLFLFFGLQRRDPNFIYRDQMEVFGSDNMPGVIAHRVVDSAFQNNSLPSVGCYMTYTCNTKFRVKITRKAKYRVVVSWA
jgi:hypothetical protein